MIELSPEIIILAFISFVSGFITGYIIKKNSGAILLKKAEFFAVIFASLWGFTVMTGMEVSQYFHIVGLMSAAHLLGEKAIENFMTLYTRKK